MVEPNEEQDSAGNVDERIDAVDPMHHGRISQKPLLNSRLPENMKALLEMDELQCMVSCNMDGAFHQRHSRKCPTELINPVDERPVPHFHEEREAAKVKAQESFGEDCCVG